MTGEENFSNRESAPIEGDGAWTIVDRIPALDPSGVHVWMADVPSLGFAEPRFRECLDPAERERAGRFRFEKDRFRFILSHGWKRVLLGRYLGERADAVPLDRTAFGKPFVRSESARPAVQFSLSHSGDLVALAFTTGRPVGVDIERIDPRRATLDVAERFFSREEVEGLRALSPAQRCDAFFRCWTRKEAYVKARGEGLSRRLERFTVSLGPEVAPTLRACGAGEEDAADWSLEDLSAPSGYAGAIAAQGSGWSIRRFRASPDLLAAG